MFALFVFVGSIEYVGRFEAVDRYVCILSNQPDYVRFIGSRNNLERAFVCVLQRAFQIVYADELVGCRLKVFEQERFLILVARSFRRSDLPITFA